MKNGLRLSTICTRRSQRRRGVLVWLSVAVLVLGGGFLSQAVKASAAEIADGLALWYELDDTSGTVAHDSSGHGRDGKVNGTAAWGGDKDGLTFDGAGAYVALPNNLMQGMTSITVATDVYVDPAQPTPYFIYGLGNSSGRDGNGYLFTTGDDYRSVISSGNWSAEQNTRPSPGHGLPRGVWKHLTFTLSGNTGVLYEDGAEVGRNTAITHTPGGIGGGTTTANYIGRSVYADDKLFKGKIRDFRVYDRALSGADVARLAEKVNPDVARANAEIVAKDKAELSLGATNDVTGNLTPPKAGPHGSGIRWASSNPALITADGVVTRPARGRPDAVATLTATLSRGSAHETKAFTVTVRAEFDDSQTVNRAAAALTVANLSDVRGNLTLPATGENGTTITWKSDRPTVVSPTGEVRRPAPGSGSVTVVLIATVRKNGAESSRTFVANVPPLPAKQDLAGYVFSYFTGEGTADGEQLHSALSNGNDPLHWRELNRGKPVLTSTLGTRGVRDPFIIRSPEGDKFYQIATDLKIFGNGDWRASQRTGSKSIMVWESTDLVNWTDQRLVKVSPDTAGNTWAPEAFYDDKLGAYVVFWASMLYGADDPEHKSNSYNRMMYATTRDFYTFSEPKVWFDPGYSVIDSPMIKQGDAYYRFTKDERNRDGKNAPCGKFVMQQRATSVLDTAYRDVQKCIGSGVLGAGEGPLVFKSNTGDRWYLFLDEFSGRGYVPFETTDLASGKWTPVANYSLPSSPRHGTVLPVTKAEYERLLASFPPG